MTVRAPTVVLALFDSLPRTKITMSSSWASCYRWGKGLRWKKPNKKTRNVIEVWAMVGRNMIGILGVRMTSHSRQVEVAQAVTMAVCCNFLHCVGYLWAKL